MQSRDLVVSPVKLKRKSKTMQGTVSRRRWRGEHLQRPSIFWIIVNFCLKVQFFFHSCFHGVTTTILCDQRVSLLLIVIWLLLFFIANSEFFSECHIVFFLAFPSDTALPLLPAKAALPSVGNMSAPAVSSSSLNIVTVFLKSPKFVCACIVTCSLTESWVSTCCFPTQCG